jgi:hypothetical protein
VNTLTAQKSESVIPVDVCEYLLLLLKRFSTNFNIIYIHINSPQAADHLLWEYELIRKQRQVLRNSIMKVGGNWPITNFDLANKYTKLFKKF